jgi:hypothetical protein
MAKMVLLHPSIPREVLLDLVQPASLNESQKVSGTIFRKCQLCGLIAETQDKSRAASLIVDPVVAADLEAFRTHMQSVILGATDQGADHFVFNQFTAWFITQDTMILQSSKRQLEAKFHEDMYPGVPNRVISDEPGIGAWQSWAQFLGYGWQSEFSVFIPDCTVRIQPLLPELLPEDEPIPFGVFMDRLAVRCPELDGGVLFERCWEASRPNERRGNRLSLMLSTALRVLNQQGRIALENRADATENWMLFAAQSYISRVTHIRLGIER